MDPEVKEVCGCYDSDATEGVKDEKVCISCDYPIGTTADRQLEHLVVLGIATGSNRLGDLYQLGVPEQQSKEPFSLTRVRVKDASHHLVSQELLQNFGSQATGPRILRDLSHDIVEGFVGPRDITQTKIEEEIQLATILVRRGSIGVSQIRIHGDRD